MASAAVKRIRADIRELALNPSSAYVAAPVEDNLFLWHFTVRGPQGTEFAGGIYHGRISLPPEWPFKPPSIILLTPNGRFEVNKKICLSLTAHHPEHWQPAWGIRTILEALIAFFPTPADSAIGALQWRPDERMALAAQSRSWVCATCGSIADLLKPECTPSPPRAAVETTPAVAEEPVVVETPQPPVTPMTDAPDTTEDDARPSTTPQDHVQPTTPLDDARPRAPAPPRVHMGRDEMIENALIVAIVPAILTLLYKKFLL